MSLTTEQVATFWRDGYLLLDGIVDRGTAHALRDEVLDLFSLHLGRPMDDDAFVAAYQHDRDRWRRCARRMFDLPVVVGLADHPRVLEALRDIGHRRTIVSTRPEVRTDMPDDDAYRQPWHQDWRYGQGSVNATTLWVPLQDTTPSNGTIQVKPGSHLGGYAGSREIPDPRRFVLPDEAHQRYPTVDVSVRAGQAVLFSQLLMHQSGHNTSGAARVSMQARHSDAAEPRFLAEGWPTALGLSDVLWSRPPTAEDVAAVVPRLEATA